MTRLCISVFLMLSSLLGQATEDDQSRFSFLPFTHDAAMTYGIGRLIVNDLPDGHSEVRIWVGFGAEYVNKTLILRSEPGENITGEVLVYFPSNTPENVRPSIGDKCVNFQRGDHGTDVCTQIFEEEPNWNFIYRRLSAAGLMMLPDQSKLPPPKKRVLDGVSVVVELRTGSQYRYYQYSNPHHHGAPEADSAAEIIKIVKGVFKSGR